MDIQVLYFKSTEFYFGEDLTPMTQEEKNFILNKIEALKKKEELTEDEKHEKEILHAIINNYDEQI